MLIGELAKALGVTPKTLRHYEEIGLVPPPQRADNAYRVYSEPAIARARLVVGLRAMGLSIEQVQGLLAVSDEHLRTRLMGLLDQQLQEMSLQIAILQGRHDDLEARYRALVDAPRAKTCVCAALLRPCDCGQEPETKPKSEAR